MPDKKRPPSQVSNFFFIQTSLLFTDSRRRRLLRINNVAIPITSRASDIYLGMDYSASICAFTKELLIQLCSAKPLNDIQIELISRFKSILKQMCQGTDSEFQTEQMSYMGLAFLGIFKLLIFRAQHYSDYQNPIIDCINWLKVVLNRMPVDMLFKQVNPLLFNLSEYLKGPASEVFEYPETLELTWASVADKDCVLMDDGIQMNLVFSSLQNPLCSKLFR